MANLLKCLSSFLIVSQLFSLHAAPAPIDYSRDRWPALWITVPGSDPTGYGVYHFRKHFNITSPPTSLRFFVSADNRYQLYVNGDFVSSGPARSDIFHWRYEIVDIAAKLHPGPNTLAAVVSNDGPYHAVAQNSVASAFLLQAEDPAFWSLNTNSSWHCVADAAYQPQHISKDQLLDYQAVGANEHFDGNAYPWGWQRPDFDDHNWPAAQQLSAASPRIARDGPNSWMLVPSPIPEESQEPLRLSSIRESNGLTVSPDFPLGHHPFTVPANSHATVLLDQSFLTTAYPQLTVSNGAASEVRLSYAETLYDPTTPKPLKSNRNDVTGKIFLGRFDTFLPDGGEHRTYQPLFWRTYRYLKLDISTKDQPLTIEDLRALYTGYPFERVASIHLADPKLDREVQDILTTGWRTARLCAHETYMDCPYYEQLQYVGDSRIQMLISLYNSGDARLMRKGIEDINASRTAEGVTYSRAPSSLAQYIPPFSLWWIGIVHDYWMYVDDPAFVKSMLPGVESILRFFAQYQKPNGSLQKLPWWNFVDWTRTWNAGEAPADPDGSSAAALDLQLVLAYQWAADLEKAFANPSLADQYRQAANQLQATVRTTDWDPSRQLFADQPTHRTYSQQVNTLAVLAGLLPKADARAVLLRALSQPDLETSSIYFQAYTNAALTEVGEGAHYLDRLGSWVHMLQQGLTTWAEVDLPDTRSDCHAWGASPNIEIYRTLAGVTPASPGFRSVRIEPNLGAITGLHAVIPHPAGKIEVAIDAGKVNIALPQGISGTFVWKGSSYPLHPGNNQLSLPSAKL